jgi:hypothetical protein
MTDKMTVDKAIENYVKLRIKKQEIENVVKEKTKKIDGLMTKLEHFLMTECAEQNVESFKTEHGTAFIKETDYASVDDWDAVIAFVAQEDAFEFMTKKVNKTAVKEYIEENKMPPPGMSYGLRKDIQIRVPTTKSKK